MHRIEGKKDAPNQYATRSIARISQLKLKSVGKNSRLSTTSFKRIAEKYEKCRRDGMEIGEVGADDGDGDRDRELH